MLPGPYVLAEKRSQLRDQFHVKSNNCPTRVVGGARLLNQQHCQNLNEIFHITSKTKKNTKKKTGLE
jgi:hypothetical protein